MRGEGLSVINDVECTKSPTNRTKPIFREAPLIIINEEDILSTHRKSFGGHDKKINKLGYSSFRCNTP